jgi:ABC-2 type transport system ATP-binding protein
MGQRLGIASALLADPQTIILDEPVNGLDPEGIRWVRGLLRNLAADGRTVFLSSHLMSETELTADHVIIIGHGRLIADLSIDELRRSAGADRIHIRSPHADRLRTALAGPDITIASSARDLLEVTGVSAEVIGQIAADQQVVLHELTPIRVSLEETFMTMTHDAVEYTTGTPETAVAA